MIWPKRALLDARYAPPSYFRSHRVVVNIASMDAMVRLRRLDELPGAWRSLRQAARFVQVITGLVVLVNVALLLLMDRVPTDVRWVEMLNYMAVIMAFSALTGGFWAENRRQSREDSEDSATFG